MKYNAILFDFDGTLTESGLGITRSCAYAFEQLGLPVPSQQELDTFVGPPLVASFMKYGNMTEEEAMHATDLYRVRYRSIGWKENRVYAGIAPMLKALKKQGAFLSIASAKPEVFVRQIAEYFGIARYFDKIVGITFETTHADKTELILSALPEDRENYNIAMVGDRLYDMEAAKKCNLTAIGVSYGYGSHAELEESGADLICDTVEELHNLLLPGVERERGLFISLEGADGCGKSTQLELLKNYIDNRGYEVVVTREPGGCTISEAIRDVVLDVKHKGMSAECEALLYAASRAEHVRQVIIPAVKNGKIVLCDRFLDSSFAYQARGRELGDDFIRQINAPAMAIAPDRTLLFVGDREKVLSRLRSHDNLDRMEIEKDEFFIRVYDAFEELHRASPDRIHRIDSNRSIEEIAEDVRNEIDGLLT